MSSETGTKKKKQRSRSYQWVFAIFIVICLAVSAFSYQYYRKLHTTIRAESKNYLQEVSRQIGKNINRVIEDNFSMLSIMGVSLEAAHEATLEQAQSILRARQGYGDFDNILLVDRSGKAYDVSDSQTTFLSLDDVMRADLLNRQQSIATAQIVNNKEYIIFAVPLNNVTVGGEEIIALAASYDPAALDTVLSMTSFNDQAYSQIVTKSGTVVTRSSSPYAIKSGYNIFTTLENAALDVGSDLARMRRDIQDNAGDQISFLLDDVHRYMVYTPIQTDDWYLLTFVPFQAVNEKSDLLLRSTLLICGLIAAAFCGLVAALLYLFSTNRKRLERIAYVDEVTGGNSIQRFYELAREALDAGDGLRYAMIFTNIESFKVLNTQLGRKNCDLMLMHFYRYTVSTLSGGECVGRFAADNFCILMNYQNVETLLRRLEEWGIGAERYITELKLPWHMPMTEFGIYVIDNQSLGFPEMVDRAKMALREAPCQVISRLRYSFYDNSKHQQLFREKQLSDMMEEALANREFQLYLQPKWQLSGERIGGAEALVRWVSKAEGMIFPNDFIPLFERNGFIVQVDLWIFEEVCRTMRSWLDRGLQPVKVSVNCSRVHFKNPYFLTPYIKIATQYGIDRSLLEIELTESVVFENTEELIKIIQEIRNAGFSCSMDDFGSGYSSLNLIQSIPVDTLKIDRIFFHCGTSGTSGTGGTGDAIRTEAVVGSIISMARALSMTTVAEGVEYPEQVDMLRRVGCDYIQGFVFAKPMPVEEFEALAFETQAIDG